MAGLSQGAGPVPTTKTPEPRPEILANGQANTPSTPGTFATFDWEEFEARYVQALEKADGQEEELLREFDELVKVLPILARAPTSNADSRKYFNNWAASSSAHDTERAIKRLQTRQRFVNLSEQTMAKRQQHSMPVYLLSARLATDQLQQ